MDLVRHRPSQGKVLPKAKLCLLIYSHMVNSQTLLGAVLTRKFPSFVAYRSTLKGLFRAYQREKRRQNVVDYDDILRLWLKLMGDEEISKEIRARFDHVLVDEYQDTNRLQFLILKKLKPTGRGLMVVGDDSQAIYGFRAAEVCNILDFAKQFKRTPRIIKLEQNYRSTQPILDACNAVINPGEGRFQKNLWSDRPSKRPPRLVRVRDEIGQAKFVCDEIVRSKSRGIPLREQAVLIRTSQDSVALETELARRKIPFRKFGGVKFLETAHIRDLLSIFRWFENPRDRMSGSRVLQLIPGIGTSNAAKLLDELNGRLSARRLRRLRVPARSGSGRADLVRAFGKVEHRQMLWSDEVKNYQ
jgi:DNA helicase-2/ATP-dependent DNA helicase PcrA